MLKCLIHHKLKNKKIKINIRLCINKINIRWYTNIACLLVNHNIQNVNIQPQIYVGGALDFLKSKVKREPNLGFSSSI